MELGDLFPADCKEEVYADFPPSTQDKTGWGGSFQNYVDILFTKGLIEAPTCVNAFPILIRCSNTGVDLVLSGSRQPFP